MTFVLTGDCGNTSHPGYEAYEQIAAISSGQVFSLKKNQVGEVSSGYLKNPSIEKRGILPFFQTANSYHSKNIPLRLKMKHLSCILILMNFSLFQILVPVREALQTRKVNLLSIDNEAGGQLEVNLPVDPRLEEFTVQVSGDKPRVHVFNPDGQCPE